MKLPGKASWFASLEDFHKYLDILARDYGAPSLAAHKALDLHSVNTRFYAWLRSEEARGKILF